MLEQRVNAVVEHHQTDDHQDRCQQRLRLLRPRCLLRPLAHLRRRPVRLDAGLRDLYAGLFVTTNPINAPTWCTSRMIESLAG